MGTAAVARASVHLIVSFLDETYDVVLSSNS